MKMGKEDIQIEFIKSAWTNTLIRMGLVFEQKGKEEIHLSVEQSFGWPVQWPLELIKEAQRIHRVPDHIFSIGLLWCWLGRLSGHVGGGGRSNRRGHGDRGRRDGKWNLRREGGRWWWRGRGCSNRRTNTWTTSLRGWGANRGMGPVGFIGCSGSRSRSRHFF